MLPFVTIAPCSLSFIATLPYVAERGHIYCQSKNLKPFAQRTLPPSIKESIILKLPSETNTIIYFFYLWETIKVHIWTPVLVQNPKPLKGLWHLWHFLFQIWHRSSKNYCERIISKLFIHPEKSPKNYSFAVARFTRRRHISYRKSVTFYWLSVTFYQKCITFHWLSALTLFR